MTTVLSRLARRWQWLALLIVLATPALATHDCLNYSEYFHQLSVMEAGSIRQLAYATPLLFVGSHRIDDWALQLLIFNLSDPLRPLPLGGLLWPEHEDREIEAILPVEDTLYLTIEDFGLVTIDISDPTEPAVIAEVPLGHSGEMQMVDDVLVIAAGEPGVVLLDVADAANPAVLGTLQTVEAQGIAVRDGLLYVADGMGGMEVINIADPSMPRRLHITSFADESQDIELFGDVAVLAQRDQGIRAVDIADPLDWQRILPSTPTETVWRFSREGDRLLTISGQPDPGWLRVYDLSDPLNAVPIMQYPVHKNRAVFADGLLASAGSSVCIAAQTPTALAPILGSLSHPGEAYVSACFSGGFLFVAGTGGVHVIDASEVSTFQVLTTLLPGKRCFGIATDGERVYVPVQREGLHVLDISDPFAAELVGYVDIPLRLGGIALQEQVCALIVESSSIRLYDVSRPERIKELGAIEVADHLRELDFRSGGVLAVAADSDGLILVDCSTPTAPTIAGSFDRPYKEVDVAVQGDLAFTLNQHLGLAILDISEANIPHLVGSAALPSSAYGFDVADGYAFIACNYDGTQILDVSDPAHPAYIGNLPETASWAYDVWIGPAWFCVAEQAIMTFGALPCGDLTVVPAVGSQLADGLLLRAFPNPGRDGVTIDLGLRIPQAVRVSVHDVTGRLCAVIAERPYPAGQQRLVWDGRHGAGGTAASGVYFIRAQGATAAASTRIVMVG